jgi:diacylglycerol kinase (ATP)
VFLPPWHPFCLPARVPRSVWLIANPISGRKAGLLINPVTPDDARRALERVGFRPELRVTERPGHATLLAHQAVAAGAELVVAAGGDGTIHEVARALVGRGVRLGMLPLGSLLNLPRALDLPRDLDRAAEVVREGRTIELDVGQATTGRGQSYFFEAAGVGFDAQLFAYAQQIDRGRFRYLLPFARTFLRFRPRRARVVVDDRRLELRNILMVSVALSPYTGLRLLVAPDARLDDHRFDVVIRRADHWRDLVGHVAALVLGPPGLRAKTGTLHARAVEIHHNRHPMVVHADGESIGRTPVELRILPAAIPVIAGPEPTVLATVQQQKDVGAAIA